jgi:hypothetical protein
MSRSRIAILLAGFIVVGIGVLLYPGAPRSVSIGPAIPGSPIEPGKDGPSRPSEPLVLPAPVSGERGQGPVPGLVPLEQKKWFTLLQILESKRDNDPRIDTELKDLSPLFKLTLAMRYAELKPEKFNERGTLVFLVGRELVNPADVDFMRTVLTEKPCLSVTDCSRVPVAHAGEDDHREMVNETTVRYPQLMALRALKQKWAELQREPSGHTDLIRQIRETLEEASRSADPRIADGARAILKGQSPKE